MATPTVNVLRWSALGCGLVYGIVHHNSLSSRVEKRKANEEVERKEKLIAEARAEWAKKNTSSGGVITDPRHPNFDAEAFAKAKAGQKA